VDLAEEGFDIAIRIMNDPPPNVVARKLAMINRKMCATPAYFARHGVPKTPEDLERHNCLTYSHFNPHDSWRLRGPQGEIILKASGNLRLNDDDALAEAVLADVGIAVLPTFLIGKELQNGRLQSVLSEYIPRERSIYAVYLPTRYLPAKIRRFIDYLLERFGPQPYWDKIS
jgi:DNA-binding transcriptional LysR family regulator